MPISPFKANVGVSRISNKLDSTRADFTRSVRANMQEIIQQYTDWVNHMQEASPEVLKEALEPTFAMSQEIVPVRTGDLKESGYLEVRSFRGSAQVEIGYGKGGQPDYAVMVHENPDMHHAAPTQYKFLQQPLEQDIDNVKQRILDGMKSASGTS